MEAVPTRNQAYMNGGSVITNPSMKLKIGHVFGDNVFPKFSIMNPKLTFTIPRYQMVSGFFDIMSHILEQYFSNEDDNTSDYIMEGWNSFHFKGNHDIKSQVLLNACNKKLKGKATWVFCCVQGLLFCYIIPPGKKFISSKFNVEEFIDFLAI